jgi:putative resolvase
MNNESIKCNKKFITTRETKKIFGVNEDTLRRWADNGKIEYIRSPGGKRLYNVEQYINSTTKYNYDNSQSQTIQEQETIIETQNPNICYCRVSSRNQKEDLERQVQKMQEQFPGYQIITDIGSGINWKRKGLRSILDLTNKRLIQKVVVAYRDRLCRFAFELIEWILQQNQVELVVLNSSVESGQDTELAEDLLAIINVFNCRVNGRRKYKTKKQSETEEEN